MPTGEQDKDISETDMVGRQVGKYRITRLLGRGGMGAVFELVHESVGQRAAIKVLLAKYAQDPEFVKRFFDEAMVVNRIQHQGVVKSFDHGQLPDGNLYIVMELLLGESMRARLEQVAEQKSRLAFSTTASLMIQLVDTLAEVHEKGVIHRELMQEIFPSQSTHYTFGGKAGGRTQQWSYFWLRLSIEYFWFCSFA